MKNKFAFTTIALGAAYLLRNPKARKKLVKQFESLRRS
ncbi:hypothetical protein J2S17_000837 [Cytobacillus purgationiresistens]|uniref:Uncharacterized protein n=1 Tax=Cytobacillus purgationiresistens TaxID=863449 RepID=A0ABU0AEV0_9BACI|nr:hypothetical protein [Cytobacillus purgationiresistens]